MSPTESRVYRFAPDGLDPITVYVDSYGVRAGRMTVQCYTRAWTAYWGAMGNDGLEHFVLSCNTCYVVDYLIQGIAHLLRKSNIKNDREYLTKIVEAIKVEFANKTCNNAEYLQQ